jgi:hypothetical protein
MRPALPETRPAGRVVKIDSRTGAEAQPQPQKAAAQPTQQDNDKAALQTLSSAANSAAAKSQARPQPAAAQAPTAAGVTAPAVGLAD